MGILSSWIVISLYIIVLFLSDVNAGTMNCTEILQAADITRSGISCDFNNSTCGYTVSGQWTRTKSYNFHSNKIDVGIDKSPFVVYNRNTTGGPSRSVITSPELQPGTYCLSFYIYTTGFFEALVVNTSTGHNVTNKLKGKINSGWQKHVASVNETTAFKIEFNFIQETTFGLGKFEAMGIDSILIVQTSGIGTNKTDTSCTPGGRVSTNGTCDFDDDTCGYTIQGHFERKTGLFNYAGNVVSQGHGVNSSYIVCNWEKIRASNNNTLTSPLIKPGTYCLTFWYYFTGKKVGLSVFSSSGKALFANITDPETTHAWTQVSLSVRESKPFQVSFQMLRATGFFSELQTIAVDDITLSSVQTEVCTENVPAGRCTFSNGKSCGFTMDTDRWIIQNGPFSVFGRPITHSGQDDSFYALFEPFKTIPSEREGQIYDIKTTELIPGHYCLSFWYILPNHYSNMSVLTLSKSGDNPIWSEEGVKKEWTEATLNMTQTVPFKIVFRSRRYSRHSTAFAGLDNIKLTKEPGTTNDQTTVKLATVLTSRTVKSTAPKRSTVKSITAASSLNMPTSMKLSTRKLTVKSTTKSRTAIPTTIKQKTTKISTVKSSRRPTSSKPTTTTSTTVKRTTIKPTRSKPTTVRSTTSISTTVKPTSSKSTTAKTTPKATTTKTTAYKPTTEKTATPKSTSTKSTKSKPTTFKLTTVKPTLFSSPTSKRTTSKATTLETSSFKSTSTTVKPPPSKSTTVKPPPSKSTTVRPPPSNSTTVKPPPSKSTTVKPPTSKSTTIKPPPSNSTTVKPPTSKSTTVKSPPSKSTTVKPPPSKSTTVKPPPSKSTTVKPPPSKSTTVKPPTSKSTTVKPPTSKSTTVKPAPSKSTTVKPPPSKSTKVKPAPSKSTTIKPTSSKSNTSKKMTSNSTTSKINISTSKSTIAKSTISQLTTAKQNTHKKSTGQPVTSKFSTGKTSVSITTPLTLTSTTAKQTKGQFTSIERKTTKSTTLKTLSSQPTTIKSSPLSSKQVSTSTSISTSPTNITTHTLTTESSRKTPKAKHTKAPPKPTTFSSKKSTKHTTKKSFTKTTKSPKIFKTTRSTKQHRNTTLLSSASKIPLTSPKATESGMSTSDQFQTTTPVVYTSLTTMNNTYNTESITSKIMTSNKTNVFTSDLTQHPREETTAVYSSNIHHTNTPKPHLSSVSTSTLITHKRTITSSSTEKASNSNKAFSSSEASTTSLVKTSTDLGKIGSQSHQNQGSGNGGAIAGGVIGGILVVGLLLAVLVYIRMKHRRLGNNTTVMDDQTEPTFDKSKRNSNNLGLQPIGGQSMDSKYGGVDMQPENGYTDNVRDSTKTFENLNPNY